MRLNLSDAVDDLAPIEPPPCFHSRIAWLMYLKSTAAAQNSRHNQKAIITDADGPPRFNDRLNYCADCTQAKSMEMLALGRCDPYHLSDQPDPPDTSDAPNVRPDRAGKAGFLTGFNQTKDLDDTCTTSAHGLPSADADNGRTLSGQPQGDAFARLVAHLLALGAVPSEQKKRPVVRVSGQRRALVAS